MLLYPRQVANKREIDNTRWTKNGSNHVLVVLGFIEKFLYVWEELILPVVFI